MQSVFNIHIVENWLFYLLISAYPSFNFNLRFIIIQNRDALLIQFISLFMQDNLYNSIVSLPQFLHLLLPRMGNTIASCGNPIKSVVRQSWFPLVDQTKPIIILKSLICHVVLFGVIATPHLSSSDASWWMQRTAQIVFTLWPFLP